MPKIIEITDFIALASRGEFFGQILQYNFHGITSLNVVGFIIFGIALHFKDISKKCKAI